MIETLFAGFAGALAAWVLYRFGIHVSQPPAVEKLRQAVDNVVAAKCAEAFDNGCEEGRRLALQEFVSNPEVPQGYRTAAARAHRVCGSCGRTCLHCAKDRSSQTSEHMITLRLFRDPSLAIPLSEISFDQDIVKIGKLPSSHLKLGGDEIGRMHAVLERVGHQYWVIDLGTNAGTYVNGKRTSKHLLQNDDVITFGDTRAVVTLRP